jgi:hypothetical protein
VYTTTQTHSLGAKAALILGLSVRAIAVDPGDAFALRGSALKAALEEDASAGKKPFVLSQSISLLYRRKFYCQIQSRPSAQRPLERSITCMRSAKSVSLIINKNEIRVISCSRGIPRPLDPCRRGVGRCSTCLSRVP